MIIDPRIWNLFSDDEIIDMWMESNKLQKGEGKVIHIRKGEWKYPVALLNEEITLFPLAG